MRSYAHLMKLSLSYLVLSCWSGPIVEAMYEDDVGLSDFLIATTGHGATKFIHPSSESVVTSDSPIHGHQLLPKPSATSCFVASRELERGTLKWRRNVCAKEGRTDNNDEEDRQYHAVAASEETWWTMDAQGIVRGWAIRDGRLLWDALVHPTNQPRLLVPPGDNKQPSAVGAVVDEQIILLDALTGEQLGQPLTASQVLKDNGSASRGDARWLQMVAAPDENKWSILVGWIHSNRDGTTLMTTGSDLMVVDLEFQEESIHVTGSNKLNHIRGNLDVSTLQVMASGKALALNPDRNQALQFDVSNLGNHFESADVASSMEWTTLTEISSMSNAVARVAGVDANGKRNSALFQLASWKPFQHQSQAVSAAGMVLATCDDSSAFAVAMYSETSSLMVWQASDGVLQESMVVNTDMPTAAPPANSLESPSITVLGCTDYYLHALVTTPSGTTSHLQLTLSKQSNNAVPFWKWTAEEGLGQISSALILDASHAIVADDLLSDDSQDEPDEIARRLKLSARLSSQMQSILGGASSSSSTKERLFGFIQAAVFVSESTHRLYGVELSGENRGKTSWTLNLPKLASWHKLVHGTANAPKSVHGIQGGTHAREVLVLSGNSETVQWQCLDGIHGEIHAHGSQNISSPVLQIMPLLGGGSCRQQALLMHEDKALSLVPEGAATESAFQHALEVAPNGFYSHILSGERSATRLEAYQITSKAAPAQLVGQASFPGEKLVHAVYPRRDEVVQSPCNVLGDDSLLLKYLNPHMAVAITVRDNSISEEDPFDVALKKARHEDSKKKKKPQGATPKGATPKGATPKGASKDSAASDMDNAAVKEDEPNLFVNIVDTVSGRILYRASHANAATSARNIKAVISENWIIYTFVNAKTRRAEIGVLSLYEGMIHRKGLTAFTTPDQTTEFSSWDARESKPVVLAKTYSIPKPVTSLGITQTRNGISPHQILLATTDDRIFAVERRMLEPRRPLSDLKEHEKLEGLYKYSELVPLISLQALSYNLTVHAPTRILSAPTELESQTLVLAYGGPDVFFTRTSPSKGFDMLPESFNRVLLSMLVVGLISVVFVTRTMAARKMVKHGWI